MTHLDAHNAHADGYRMMKRLLSGRMAMWPLAMVRDFVEKENRYLRSLTFASSMDIDLAGDIEPVVRGGTYFLNRITPVPPAELREWVGRQAWVTLIQEKGQIAAACVEVVEIGDRPLVVGEDGPEYTAVALRAVDDGTPMVMWADRVVAIGESPPADDWDPLGSPGGNPWATPGSDDVWDQLGP